MGPPGKSKGVLLPSRAETDGVAAQQVVKSDVTMSSSLSSELMMMLLSSASRVRLLLALEGGMRPLWLCAEVLGPPLPSHWLELGSPPSRSSFSSLGETWLLLST